MGPEWKHFKKAKLNDIARQAGVEGHYHAIYKMACEAAHMGDLMVYIPPQPQEPGLRFVDLSLLKTYICLKFGIILACDVIHDASTALSMNLDQQLDGVRQDRQAVWAECVRVLSEALTFPPRSILKTYLMEEHQDRLLLDKFLLMDRLEGIFHGPYLWS
jgi:hypothetical protein